MVKIKSIFLGDYFKWDPELTYKFSKKYGFKNVHGTNINDAANGTDLFSAGIVARF